MSKVSILDLIVSRNQQQNSCQPSPKLLKPNLWKNLAKGFLLILIFVEPVQAQKPTQSNQPLRISTGFSKPFVYEENGTLTGFSIDLWNSIKSEMNVKSEFSVYPNTLTLLSSVKSGQADAAISSISITSERQQDFDFSQPIFEGGLQILVLDQSSGANSIPNLLIMFFSPAMGQLLIVIIVMLFVPAHLIWFFERRRESGLIPTQSYFPGIFKAFWWAAATLATQADEMPKSPIGRFIAIIWMFTSVVFVAYFTATVTTSLTVQQLQGNIKGPDDLPGKRVATVTGSTSAAYLRQKNAKVLEFDKLTDAYDTLLQKKADAVVFDAPVLLYYAAHDGKGKVQLIGNIFRKESYGIALPPNSPYRQPINSALLRLQENGTYQQIYDKWFSNKEDK